MRDGIGVALAIKRLEFIVGQKDCDIQLNPISGGLRTAATCKCRVSRAAVSLAHPLPRPLAY